MLTPINKHKDDGADDTTGAAPCSSWHRATPIGWDDVVTVEGRHLVRVNNNNKNKNNDPFLMQGIAFPTPLASDAVFDVAGWMAVLEQLANQSEINTIRVYRLDCQSRRRAGYQQFLQRAAELGIYVLVPLTNSVGDGVLDRTLTAPLCYNRSLYHYGRACLDLLWDHPNVLAGVLGNEVMNKLDAWHAAPCLTAYGRDLKRYMRYKINNSNYDNNNNSNSNNTNNSNSRNQRRTTPLPLMYAAQNDSPTADVLPEAAMKLTVDYLTCVPDDNDDETEAISGIDIFGINVESWCSSLQTYEYNEDGMTHSGYYSLHETLQNVSIPLVFSEMGCPQNLFNRENGLPRYVRDWKQVPVVLEQMNDRFDGFCAYTYAGGNPEFAMMQDKLWDGHHALPPGPDFENFAAQLAAYHRRNGCRGNSSATSVATAVVALPPTCRIAQANLEGTYHITLPLVPLPQYYSSSAFIPVLPSIQLAACACIVVASAVAVSYWYRRQLQWRHRMWHNNNNYDYLAVATTGMTNYQSVHSSEEDDDDAVSKDRQAA